MPRKQVTDKINEYSNKRILGNHLNAIKARGRDRVEHHVTTEHEDVMNCFNQKGLLNIFQENEEE